jgi:hypothetical protein
VLAGLPVPMWRVRPAGRSRRPSCRPPSSRRLLRESQPRPEGELVQNGTLKTYPGFPHGMPTTHADTINNDLLAFIQS